MSFWTDLEKGAVQVIKTVAPTLAATAAGPFAPLVLPIVQKIFGTADASTVNAALTNATPEQLLALKQADAQLQEQLKALDIQEEDLPYQDTANARNMAIQTKDPTAGRLAWLVVGGFLVFALLIVTAMVLSPSRWAALPADAASIIGMVLGYLASEAKQAGAFYFGSSADSQAKTQTLSEIAKS